MLENVENFSFPELHKEEDQEIVEMLVQGTIN